MHIQSITLENFRCFEKLSLELHPRLNVFFGENGSGKSSIIEGINILLGNIIQRLGKNTAIKTNFSYKDIHNNSRNVFIELSLHDENVFIFGLSGDKTIKNGEFSAHTVHAASSKFATYIKSIEDAIFSAEKSQKLPIFLSYKAGRYTEYLYARNEEPYKLSITACYDDAISMNLSYDNFFKWFKAREDLENQESNQKTKCFDKELQAVRNAINIVGSFSNFIFERKDWQFIIEKDTERRFFDQLSDGERGYILLVGDIARRLAIANPALSNPLEGKGIILIDEIELHLHPKWQRTIIPKLLKTFPHCQFIVTSHSPQVLGEIEDTNSIWILEEGQEPYHPSRAYGMESSELLREVMGAESRAKDVTEALEKIDRLIDDEHFDEARAAIKELAAKTGKIPAIIGANSYLTMMGQEQVELED